MSAGGDAETFMQEPSSYQGVLSAESKRRPISIQNGLSVLIHSGLTWRTGRTHILSRNTDTTSLCRDGQKEQLVL